MVKIDEENKEAEQEDSQNKKDDSIHDPYFAPIVNLPEMEVRFLTTNKLSISFYMIVEKYLLF